MCFLTELCRFLQHMRLGTSLWYLCHSRNRLGTSDTPSDRSLGCTSHLGMQLQDGMTLGRSSQEGRGCTGRLHLVSRRHCQHCWSIESLCHFRHICSRQGSRSLARILDSTDLGSNGRPHRQPCSPYQPGRWCRWWSQLGSTSRLGMEQGVRWVCHISNWQDTRCNC